MPKVYKKSIDTGPKDKEIPLPVSVNYGFEIGDKIQFLAESEEGMGRHKRQGIVGYIAYIHPENCYILVQTQNYRTCVNRVMFRAVKVVLPDGVRVRAGGV